MGKQRGQGDSKSGELSSLDFDFQVHRDETAVKFGELQSILSVYQASFNSFRQEMMDEMRVIRDSSAAVNNRLDNSGINYGSITEPIFRGGSVGLGVSDRFLPSPTIYTLDSNIWAVEIVKYNLKVCQILNFTL